MKADELPALPNFPSRRDTRSRIRRCSLLRFRRGIHVVTAVIAATISAETAIHLRYAAKAATYPTRRRGIRRHQTAATAAASTATSASSAASFDRLRHDHGHTPKREEQHRNQTRKRPHGNPSFCDTGSARACAHSGPACRTTSPAIFPLHSPRKVPQLTFRTWPRSVKDRLAGEDFAGRGETTHPAFVGAAFVRTVVASRGAGAQPGSDAAFSHATANDTPMVHFMARVKGRGGDRADFSVVKSLFLRRRKTRKIGFAVQK